MSSERYCSSDIQTYHCQICLTTFSEDDPDWNPYVLSCGHTYCKECLDRYLAVKITDGEVSPKCFSTSTGGNNQSFTQVVSNTITDTLIINVQDHGNVIPPPEEILPVETPSTETLLIGIPPAANPPVETPSTETPPIGIPPVVANPLVETPPTETPPVVAKPCNQALTDKEIQELIEGDSQLFDKWKRFRFFRNNPHGRECPSATCRNLCLGDPNQPAMVCQR